MGQDRFTAWAVNLMLVSRSFTTQAPVSRHRLDAWAYDNCPDRFSTSL
jgi:hypothetical protein